MKSVIVDERIPLSCLNKLRELEFGVISLPCFNALQEPVSAHPDMLIFIAENEIFCHKDYFNSCNDQFNLLKNHGYKIILSSEDIAPEYPHDILFNALRLGNRIYCKTDSISEHIIRFAEDRELELINIKQGYAKCSVCTVGENAAITADISLCNAMRKCGVDVLLISPGNIDLRGYDTGFIGGTAGECGNKIYFSGNILLHPDGEKICRFCNDHGKEAISLSEDKLYDIGSMFFI